MEFLLCQPIPHDSLFFSSWTLSPKNPFPLSMLLFPSVRFSKPSKDSYSTLSFLLHLYYLIIFVFQLYENL